MIKIDFRDEQILGVSYEHNTLDKWYHNEIIFLLLICQMLIDINNGSLKVHRCFADGKAWGEECEQDRVGKEHSYRNVTIFGRDKSIFLLRRALI